MRSMDGTTRAQRFVYTVGAPFRTTIAVSNNLFDIDIWTFAFPLDETTGVFPRATQCDDGSWCCDNNLECCDQGVGVFLDATGNVASAEAAYTISYPPASGTSTGRLVST